MKSLLHQTITKNQATRCARVYFRRQRILIYALLTFFVNTLLIADLHAVKVIVDPGHGGKDPGTNWNGLLEKKYTLDIAKRVVKLLTKKKISCRLTRSSDKTVSLDSRVTIANKYKGSILVSIHLNANHNRNIRGVETYYFGKAGKRLAGRLQKSVSSATPMPNRGLRKKRFKVLRATQGAAALIELGYVSNKWESKMLKKSFYREKLANGIVKGIQTHLRYK